MVNEVDHLSPPLYLNCAYEFWLLVIMIKLDISEEKLNTSIENVSESELMEAVKSRFGLEGGQARKLARMYTQYNVDAVGETLSDVLDNIEINDDIQVLEGGSNSAGS